MVGALSSNRDAEIQDHDRANLPRPNSTRLEGRGRIAPQGSQPHGRPRHAGFQGCLNPRQCNSPKTLFVRQRLSISLSIRENGCKAHQTVEDVGAASQGRWELVHVGNVDWNEE
jgi:hypothetical protein